MSDTQLLHLVIGGELSKLDRAEFEDLSKLDFVGAFPNYKGRLRRLERRGAAHRGQCAYALFHHSRPPSARSGNGRDARSLIHESGGLFSRLWRDYIARYKLDIAALVPTLALVAGAGVSYAIILKYATDAIVAGDAEVIWFWPLVTLGATAVRAIAMWPTSDHLARPCAQSAARSARRDVRQANERRFRAFRT